MIRHAALVAQLELRKRVHSTRWGTALTAWLLSLLLVTAASVYFLPAFFGVQDSIDPSEPVSAASMLIHFAALIGITVATSAAASSLNGDRENGMLALLQATPISGWSIVLGKVLAAWINSLIFMASSIPFTAFLLWKTPQLAEGFARGYLVIALELAAFAGIGIGWSALTPRPGGSAALSVFTVLAFVLGAPIVMLGLENFTATHTKVSATAEYEQYWDDEKNAPIPESDPRYGKKICETNVQEVVISNVSRYWWLALTNPVVAVADSLPTVVTKEDEDSAQQLPCDSSDCSSTDLANTFGIFPNSTIVQAITWMKQPPSHEAIVNDCGPESGKVVFPRIGNPNARLDNEGGQYWGYTVSLHLFFGAAMAAVAVRRTRTPIRQLPRAVRIA